MHLRFQVAQGILKRLSEGLCSDLAALNIAQEQFDLVKGGVQWIAQSDRNVVTNVLNSLVYGSLDLNGLPRFAVPVEYIAATISAVVHPTNKLLACSWMEAYTHSASELSNVANPDAIKNEPISASQCFSLVCELESDENAGFISQFERRTNMKLEKQRKLTSA